MPNLKDAITFLSDLIEKILEETFALADFNDLTHKQFHYLQVIFKMKNPSLTELARELKLTKATVSVLVDNLTKKGYIKRIKSQTDKRVHHLYIDKKGKKISAIHKIAYEKMAEKISSGLSETETAILTDLLKKIVKKM